MKVIWSNRHDPPTPIQTYAQFAPTRTLSYLYHYASTGHTVVVLEKPRSTVQLGSKLLRIPHAYHCFLVYPLDGDVWVETITPEGIERFKWECLDIPDQLRGLVGGIVLPYAKVDQAPTPGMYRTLRCTRRTLLRVALGKRPWVKRVIPWLNESYPVEGVTCAAHCLMRLYPSLRVPTNLTPAHLLEALSVL